MLPTGHISAGFLTAYGVIKLLKPELSVGQVHQLYFWGMFFGFCPDLDVFYYFLKNGNLLVSGREGLKSNHRKYYSHAPVLWLVAGLLIYFLASSAYGKIIGLLLWLGSWSHFLLDSVDYGIMWLWPLSGKVYALRNREVKFVVEERSFLRHSWQFLKAYSTRLSFYLEVLIIIFGLVIYFK